MLKCYLIDSYEKCLISISFSIFIILLDFSYNYVCSSFILVKNKVIIVCNKDSKYELNYVIEITR